ncbi:radical SAM protein [Gammaproteobacteria bacterium]|nr:radical SAM protein [Gammaproteobacteria bacterium]
MYNKATIRQSMSINCAGYINHTNINKDNYFFKIINIIVDTRLSALPQHSLIQAFPRMKRHIGNFASKHLSTKNIIRVSSLFGYYLPTFLITHIDIEPIATCDLKCGFCNVPGWDRARKTKPLPLASFKKVIDSFPYVNRIKLQGMGEPLLNRNIPEMIAYASQKNIRTSIISHGGLLTPDLSARLINANLSSINFSFDGGTKETYEKVRVNANFEHTVTNIRDLRRLRDRHMTPLRIGLTCLISNPQILKEIPDLVELASDLQVDTLHIKARLKQWEELSDGGYTFRVTTNDEYSSFDRIKKEAIKLSKTLNLRLTIGDSEDLFTDENPCSWPWRSMYISTEGYVVPCCVNGMPETWNMGFIQDQPLSKIWNCREYRTLRKSLNSPHKPRTCIGCHQC